MMPVRPWRWSPLSLRALAWGLIAACSLPTLAEGQADRYHILVTNDDGIGSAGIQHAAALRLDGVPWDNGG
jgi:hypothetical protein